MRDLAARPYRGRFAPSPSGPLHAGSLIAALGSFLDAKAHQGVWLVRIEDIDPPREQPGAADTILRQLEQHGLMWDETVQWQHQHDERYQQLLTLLHSHNLTYFCTCSRKKIRARGEYYDGLCRHQQRSPRDAAIRLINDNPVTVLDDRRLQQIDAPTAHCHEDFVLRRRDQLWAYQLAVVADDRASQISHLVRGEDLAVPSLWQMTLWQQLNQIGSDTVPCPSLLHLPLAVDQHGRKLSKQNHAPALDARKASDNLWQSLQALSLTPPSEMRGANVLELLQWAIPAWRKQWTTLVHNPQRG